jgi:hypothetical protein
MTRTSEKRRSAATASATLPSPGRVIGVRRGEDRGRGIEERCPLGADSALTSENTGGRDRVEPVTSSGSASGGEVLCSSPFSPGHRQPSMAKSCVQLMAASDLQLLELAPGLEPRTWCSMALGLVRGSAPAASR